MNVRDHSVSKELVRWGPPPPRNGRRRTNREADEVASWWQLLPLERRPPAPRAWLTYCPRCGTVDGRRYSVMVRERTLDPCVKCSYVVRNRELRLKPEVVRATLEACGLNPVGSPASSGVHIPLATTCSRGHETSPRLANLRHRGGGCARCAQVARGLAKRTPEAEAIGLIQSRGFQPLAPYPGSGVPWRCMCVASGRVVHPKVDHVRELGHCCSACAKYGVQADGPTFVYLLHHSEHRALKVGIGKIGSRSDRVELLTRRFGWRQLRRLRLASGTRARAVETAVLTYWRVDLGLRPHLSSAETSGWTETVTDDACPDCSWDVALACARADEA